MTGAAISCLFCVFRLYMSRYKVNHNVNFKVTIYGLAVFIGASPCWSYPSLYATFAFSCVRLDYRLAQTAVADSLFLLMVCSMTMLNVE